MSSVDQSAPAEAPAAPAKRNVHPIILFFPAVILYHELLLRLFDSEYTAFFSPDLLRIALFSLAAGAAIQLVLDLIPGKSVSRVLGFLLLLAGTVLVCIERGCRAMFGVYFGPTTITSMAGDVLGGGFGDTVGSVVLEILPFVLLSLLPLVLYLHVQRRLIPRRGLPVWPRIGLLACAIAAHVLGVLLCIQPAVRPLYTYEFTANTAIPAVGMITAMRLDIQYALFGMPEREAGSFVEEPPPVFPNPLEAPTPTATATPVPTATPKPIATAAPSEAPDHTPEPTTEPTPEPTPEPSPTAYPYNVLDLDFEALAAQEKDKTVQDMHTYFGSLSPSQQNQYTGMFQGKNLIFITAEAFSPYCISEALTPTLYRLSHEGFVFQNYYQPDWTMSTVGGEFANCTGVIPVWINGGWTVNAAIQGKNAEPFTLGNQFKALGYSVPAWHDHLYTYYNRNKYLTLFGYDYKGTQGGGLTIPSEDLWPASDYDMMAATADSYIDAYVTTGQPFHAYYMTVSGHAGYTFGGNNMSARNREAAKAAYPDASEVVQAYIACNLELEKAMAYLVERLEAAGIADDTLIVLTADHYPYWMTRHPGYGGDADYYNELTGLNDSELFTSRYRNTLIMWSAAIEEPIVIEDPCYSCDIVPTISNLFALPYDSRLFSGRDILATNFDPAQYSSCMPLVIFASNHGQGNSWITAAGTYEAYTRTFTPNEGITVADDYVSKVNRLVAGKINYAKLIVTKDYYAHLPLDTAGQDEPPPA